MGALKLKIVYNNVPYLGTRQQDGMVRERPVSYSVFI
jgi:hypothetical protein